MRNAAALPLINGGAAAAATRCYEGRRAWSANPSRSVGGTPICLRRRVGTTTRQHQQQQQQQLQHYQQQEQRKAVELPQRQVYSPPATRSASIFDRNYQVYPASGPSSLGAMTTMSASELALIEADREADLKYAQLILEAERMLVSAQRHFEDANDATTTPCSSRASCYNTDSGTTTVTNNSSGGGNTRQSNNNAPPNPPPRNKRVESIKNAELNIELALSRSRNSQPELASGSIKDLLVDHSHHNHNYSSSPKRLLQQQQKKMIEQAAVATKTTQITDHRRFNDIESTHHHHQQYSCPQSEPLKRKVYNNNNNNDNDNEGQPSSLTQSPSSCLQTPSWLRSSDGDCADLQSQTRRYSQLQRKQMLIETLRGLKRSLEDQSAALKQSCLRPI
ncbi:hypothetical protein TKK_0004772 [Trichogramma kaykai]